MIPVLLSLLTLAHAVWCCATPRPPHLDAGRLAVSGLLFVGTIAAWVIL